jgi:hypothetical protein
MTTQSRDRAAGSGEPRLGLLAGRYLLPGAICVAGIVLLVVGGSDATVGAGVVLIGVGMLVALLNVLMRLGLESNRDREREELARQYFDRHGRWPGRRVGR